MLLIVEKLKRSIKLNEYKCNNRSSQLERIKMHNILC